MAAGSAGYGAGSNTELRWPHVTATAGSTRRQPPEADFGAPSSDDVDELGRSRGSQMTSHTRSIGHGRRERGGGRWKQHGAPLETFSRLACQSEMALACLLLPQPLHSAPVGRGPGRSSVSSARPRPPRGSQRVGWGPPGGQRKKRKSRLSCQGMDAQLLSSQWPPGGQRKKAGKEEPFDRR